MADAGGIHGTHHSTSAFNIGTSRLRKPDMKDGKPVMKDGKPQTRRVRC
jgi:hypothetical protein